MRLGKCGGGNVVDQSYHDERAFTSVPAKARRRSSRGQTTLRVHTNLIAARNPSRRPSSPHKANPSSGIASRTRDRRRRDEHDRQARAVNTFQRAGRDVQRTQSLHKGKRGSAMRPSPTETKATRRDGNQGVRKLGMAARTDWEKGTAATDKPRSSNAAALLAVNEPPSRHGHCASSMTDLRSSRVPLPSILTDHLTRRTATI